MVFRNAAFLLFLVLALILATGSGSRPENIDDQRAAHIPAGRVLEGWPATQGHTARALQQFVVVKASPSPKPATVVVEKASPSPKPATVVVKKESPSPSPAVVVKQVVVASPKKSPPPPAQIVVVKKGD